MPPHANHRACCCAGSCGEVSVARDTRRATFDATLQGTDSSADRVAMAATCGSVEDCITIATSQSAMRFTSSSTNPSTSRAMTSRVMGQLKCLADAKAGVGTTCATRGTTDGRSSAYAQLTTRISTEVRTKTSTKPVAKDFTKQPTVVDTRVGADVTVLSAARYGVATQAASLTLARINGSAHCSADGPTKILTNRYVRGGTLTTAMSLTYLVVYLCVTCCVVELALLYVVYEVVLLTAE